MTNQNADLPTRLAAFCRRLPGSCWEAEGEGETEFRVLDGFLDGFARFYAEPSPELLFRCRDADRAKHPDAIRVSGRMAWDPEGWQWCDAALDGSLPTERLEELIRTSYELVLEEKDDVFREYLDIVSRRLPPRALLSALLDGSDLESKRDVIEGLLRPTLLLRTSKPDGDAAPGSTRIGGTPDLPASIDWPVHAKSRRPLAFLAQINFGEVPAEHRPTDFPAEGILYVFTVYGWQTEDDSDPDLPKGKPQPDWTQLRFEPSPSRLVPTPTPAGVNAFPATRVEFVPILTLPADVREPVFPKKFTGRTREEYESLEAAFVTAQQFALGNPDRHLLGGFANYEQEFAKEVAAEGLTLLFQLASDDNAEMMWGDGGFLYFFIKPEDLKARDFSRVFVEYQCG